MGELSWNGILKISSCVKKQLDKMYKGKVNLFSEKEKRKNYKCVVYCRVGTPEQLTQTDDKEKENKLLKITQKH